LISHKEEKPIVTTRLTYTTLTSDGPEDPLELVPEELGGSGEWKLEEKHKPTDPDLETQEYLIIAFWNFDIDD
jgi:hypothetical protein